MSEVQQTEQKPVFSLDEGLEAHVVNYRTVEAHGGTYRLASLCTDEILDWLGEKDEGKGDKIKRTANLRLAVRCICDAEGKRYIGPDGRTNERYEAAVARFQKKDAAGNKLLVTAAMELNGLGDIVRALTSAKNG